MITTLLSLAVLVAQPPRDPRVLSVGSWTLSESSGESRMLGFRSSATYRANDLNSADEVVLVRRIGQVRIETRLSQAGAKTRVRRYAVERLQPLDGSAALTVVSPVAAYPRNDLEKPTATEGVFLLAARRAVSGRLLFRDGNLSATKDADESIPSLEGDECAGILLAPSVSRVLAVLPSAVETILHDAALSMNRAGEDEVRTLSRFLVGLGYDDFRPRSLIRGKTLGALCGPDVASLLSTASGAPSSPYVAVRRLTILEKVHPGEVGPEMIEALRKVGSGLRGHPLPEEDRSFLQDVRLSNARVTARDCLNAAASTDDATLRRLILAQIKKVDSGEAKQYVRFVDDSDPTIAWLALYNMSQWTRRPELSPGEAPPSRGRPASFDLLSRSWRAVPSAELDKMLGKRAKPAGAALNPG